MLQSEPGFRTFVNAMLNDRDTYAAMKIDFTSRSYSHGMIDQAIAEHFEDLDSASATNGPEITAPAIKDSDPLKNLPLKNPDRLSSTINPVVSTPMRRAVSGSRWSSAHFS